MRSYRPMIMPEIEISPETLATLFAEMDASEQARFFNKLHERAEDWFPMQLQYITDDDGLTLEGRRVMQMIGEYSHWGVLHDLENKILRIGA